MMHSSIEEFKTYFDKIIDPKQYVDKLLSMAVQYYDKGHMKDIARYLVAFGAHDLDILLIFYMKHHEIYDHNRTIFLIELGANPRAQNDRPLRMAIKNNMYEAVPLLAKYGHSIVFSPDDNIIDRFIEYENVEYIKQLVALGANPRSNNDAAINTACFYGSDVLEYLLSIGIPLSAIRSDTIMKLIDNSMIKTIQLLVSYGLDLIFYEQYLMNYLKININSIRAIINTSGISQQKIMRYKIMADYCIDIIKYCVTHGLWDDSLDPYEYISHINELHIDRIADQMVCKIIKAKKRTVVSQFSDICIIIDSQ